MMRGRMLLLLLGCLVSLRLVCWVPTVILGPAILRWTCTSHAQLS